MRNINITLVHDDLVKGVINSYTSDPVALAAQRAGLQNPVVGRKAITFTQGRERVRAEMSPALQRFVKALAFGERHEALKVKRGKNDSISHEPVTFVVTVAEAGELKEAA